MTRLIPPVLQLATIDIELSASTLVNDIETERISCSLLLSFVIEEEKEGVETMTYEVKNLGTVSVSVNTHNMELKYYALGAIYKFIEYGGEEIMPYISFILHLAIGLFLHLSTLIPFIRWSSLLFNSSSTQLFVP